VRTTTGLQLIGGVRRRLLLLMVGLVVVVVGMSVGVVVMVEGIGALDAGQQDLLFVITLQASQPGVCLCHEVPHDLLLPSRPPPPQ
jgi:hypothetical protein